MDDSNPITRLLDDAAGGDRAAWQRLVALVYPDLKRLAHRSRAAQPGATLDTTALVHECYLRLEGAEGAPRNRGHLMALTARIMHQVLVDHAREHMAQKRGGGVAPVTLEDAPEDLREDVDTLLEIDRALQRLASEQPRAAQVFVCRYFAGYSIDDTALALDISPRTAHRDWDAAREWMAGHFNAERG